jgi:predicted GNAT family acetyltransferase
MRAFEFIIERKKHRKKSRGAFSGPGGWYGYYYGHSGEGETGGDGGGGESVTEVFDNPYAFKWDRGDFGDYDIYVKLPDGNSLTISFNNEDKDNDVWHVAFARGHSQEITGEGDAQRIFATVLHSIKQFIGKVHPEKLYFSASKEVEPGQNSESRANLYSRMVKRYASAWGYDSVVDDFGRDNVTYILNKKQPVTEEEFNGIDIDMDIEGDEIMVTAMGNGRELGHVLFVDEGEYLMPQDLEVDERFQGQGIAAAMYDYVKSKGYKIRRSGQQTDAGAGFWGKHRPEQNVWEGVNRSGVDLEVTELPDEDQILITATSHGKTLGRVYFDIFDSQLVAADAEVASEYRGQGIAAIIYDYAKELGWEVVRSGRQTDAGAGFWDKHRPKQDVWESTADDINKMFNNMYDPMTTNLQRIALMAMQGRQDEAMMQLNRVIKDASPEAQKKITDAVNNIKPVTVNGKIADSSTLDKSKKHQDWILNTFIPWVQSLLNKQDVTEEQSPTMGINVRSDGNIDYASLIIDGKKKYESRQTDSLRPYVGKTVAIVRTGKGPAVAIGQVTVGEPVVVDAEKFDKMRKLHLVPQGSKFDIGIDATKYLYPMINPIRWDNEKLVKQKGIVARKID